MKSYFPTLERLHVRMFNYAERCVIRTFDSNLSVPDSQRGISFVNLFIQIRVVLKNPLLLLLRQHAQTFEVMVAVAFDVADAETGNDGEVLR